MSLVPAITSPCPFRWNAMPVPGQDFCGQCERQVHNLDLMSAAQRNEFMQSCSGKVCVTYTVHRPRIVKNIALGLGLAAGIASGNLSAEQAIDTKVIESKLVNSVEEWKTLEAPKELLEFVVVGGTVLDADTSRWVEESEIEINAVPELPEETALQWLATPKE